MTHVFHHASQLRARKEWINIAIRKEPWHRVIKEWSVELQITQAEMVERMIVAYADLKGEMISNDNSGET